MNSTHFTIAVDASNNLNFIESVRYLTKCLVNLKGWGPFGEGPRISGFVYHGQNDRGLHLFSAEAFTDSLEKIKKEIMTKMKWVLCVRTLVYHEWRLDKVQEWAEGYEKDFDERGLLPL